MATDNGAEDRMNLAALQQCDPYIKNILQTASQVALYTFNAEGNEWEKTDIEGSLFVYARSATPYSGFMIMNRLSMNNLTEPITKELEFQLHDPFLLYKTAQSIFGLWFYDKAECQKVARLMESLVAKAKKRAKGTLQRSRSASESDAGPSSSTQTVQPVDIMQMLSRAHQAYNKTQKGDAIGDPPKKSKSPPVISSGSPIVVRPVPVKAEDGTMEQNSRQKDGADQPATKVVGSTSQGPPGHPMFNRSVSMQGSLGYMAGSAVLNSQAQPGKVNYILQKLLVNQDNGTGAVHHGANYAPGRREVQTVQSLERRQGQKEQLEKKATDVGVGQRSGQGSGVRTVTSIEREQANRRGAELGGAGGYPIQNLLAQLNIAQQPVKHDATKGGSIITQPISQGGLVRIPGLPVKQHAHGVSHAPVGVSRAPVGVSRAPVGVSHAPVGVSHAPVGVSHAPVGVSRAPVCVSHAPVGVSHAPVGVSHAPVGVSHAPIVVSHAPIGVSHAPVDMGHKPVVSRTPLATGHAPGVAGHAPGVPTLSPSNASTASLSPQTPASAMNIHKVKGQTDTDINQTLLNNLTVRAAVQPQTIQPQSSSGPVLIQPSAIRPNIPSKCAVSEAPLTLPGTNTVPWSQQPTSTSGGQAFGTSSQVSTAQTATNGVPTHVPTSPQRIPGSVFPPTLLTPNAFRKRSTSETVTVSNPTQFFHPVKDSGTVHSNPPTNQSLGGPSVVQQVSSARKSPLSNRLQMGGMVNTAEALNKEQFKQAFIHLLQNDSNFLGSLHSAYLQSLHQSPL